MKAAIETMKEPSALSSTSNDDTGLASNFQNLRIDNTVTDHGNTPSNETRMRILCDLGYGIPKEARPRKEKVLAISRQLVNFLTWQHNHAKLHHRSPAASLEIVSCPDDAVQTALENRMRELWKTNSNDSFPDNISFSSHTLEEWIQQNQSSLLDGLPRADAEIKLPVVDRNQDCIVYLSPDADESLDPAHSPPRVCVVGLLIDRRTIQTNRSKDRANHLAIKPVRWPLDRIVANISPSEPLNVDCVLEGMQQWEWNFQTAQSPNERKNACAEAIIQALEHHTQRHPERPVHKTD